MDPIRQLAVGAPVLNEGCIDHMVREGKHLVDSLRHFRGLTPNTPPPSTITTSLFDRPELYTHWLAHRGVGKIFVRWCGPIFLNSTPMNLATHIFGKDESPITALGKRSVTSYIRHLMVGRGWTSSTISEHLCTEHGYKQNSARPLVCRVFRQENDEATRGKHTRIYEENNEAAMFPEGVVMSSPAR